VAGLLGVVLGLTSAVTLNAPERSLSPVSADVSVASAAPTEVAPEPPAPAVAAPEPEPEVLSAALQIVEPRPIPVTTGELYQALARSAWPRELWPEVVRIASCESRHGSGVNSAAEGDSGRALGLLQIRVDAHRDLARQFDLLTVDGALGAAWVLYQRSGHSFHPWSCA
jgi:hypothetical protein